MQARNAIYAGSFDMPTCGHLHIIQKACRVFDNVEILIAGNPKKKPMFSSDERLDMLEDMVKGMNNATVAILPPNQYVVSYAKKKNAQFLVRGIRDSMDYNFEQNLCRTNKEIESSIETIYLMPDDVYTIVSSSWVKDMMGYEGWRGVLKDKVTPFVLQKLKENYFRSRWDDIWASTRIPIGSHKVQEAIEQYGKKTYHNLDHIIDCLEIFDKYETSNLIEKRYIKLALLFHDYHSSEEDSSKELVGIIGIHCETLVEKLIMATKHSNPENCKTEEEKFIASIDLAILGSPWEKYREYMINIAKEYCAFTIESYTAGRIEFLKNLLVKEFIYPYIPMRNDLEKNARENISKEITWIEDGGLEDLVYAHKILSFKRLELNKSQ